MKIEIYLKDIRFKFKTNYGYRCYYFPSGLIEWFNFNIRYRLFPPKYFNPIEDIKDCIKTPKDKKNGDLTFNINKYLRKL